MVVLDLEQVASNVRRFKATTNKPTTVAAISHPKTAVNLKQKTTVNLDSRPKKTKATISVASPHTVSASLLKKAMRKTHTKNK